jgi:hypothetical protein
VKVRYTVIARAEGNNIHRKIIPLPAPREEELAYRVWKRKGEWFWVDPPELRPPRPVDLAAIAPPARHYADRPAHSPLERLSTAR